VVVAVETEIEPGTEVDARVAEHVDRDLALRTVGERREQRPPSRRRLSGSKRSARIDADDRFVPAVGMFDSRDHLGLRKPGLRSGGSADAARAGNRRRARATLDSRSS
jgi:hypothetical protein